MAKGSARVTSSSNGPSHEEHNHTAGNPAQIPVKKTAGTATAPRGRKPGVSAANGSVVGGHREAQAAVSHAVNGDGEVELAVLANAHQHVETESPWLSAPIEVLHEYRRAYRLPVPSAFKNPNAPSILGHGIGLRSPTMNGSISKNRRVPREQLAKMVKKHFNDLSVNENEAIVQSMYRSKTQEKELRLRFPASRR